MAKQEELEEDKDIAAAKSKVKVSRNFTGLMKSLKAYLIVILSIREGTDFKGTLEEVRKSIVFKGPNVWILICSIFIASIGLNVNSTAVIIGAMLISPLMSPIIGIGLAAGTNNLTLLRRSFKNFAVMVTVSLLTSFIYFYFTPLPEAQTELLARTKPHLLDVFVAIFGGLAGIIAVSRMEKTNVIPGVAIATALMPPLCVAGYGLAKLNMEFFLGAFYLFLLNSIFICLSTLLVVRYLNFPKASYVDSNKERKVKTVISICTLVVIIPSGFIFWNIIQESVFNRKAEAFITEYAQFESADVVSQRVTYNDTLSLVELFLIGEIVPEKKILELNKKMADFGLEKTKLKINQAKDESNAIAGKLSEQVRSGIIEDLYKKNEEMILSKDEKIAFLEKQLLATTQGTIDHTDLKNELQAIYGNMESFSYAKMLSGNFTSDPDTVFTFLVKWNENTKAEDQAALNAQLKKHLSARLKVSGVKIINED